MTTLAAGTFARADIPLLVTIHGLLVAIQGVDGASIEFLREATVNGLKYALPVMTILFCHEMGHFLQAWRYGVRASLPFFIPMPVGRWEPWGP